MKNEKKEWKKPELTVLVRTRPEEAVLSACKQLKAGSDITALNLACLADDGFGGCGAICSSAVGS